MPEHFIITCHQYFWNAFPVRRAGRSTEHVYEFAKCSPSRANTRCAAPEPSMRIKKGEQNEGGPEVHRPRGQPTKGPRGRVRIFTGGIHWNSEPVSTATTTRRKTIFSPIPQVVPDEMARTGRRQKGQRKTRPPKKGATTQADLPPLPPDVGKKKAPKWERGLWLTAKKLNHHGVTS